MLNNNLKDFIRRSIYTLSIIELKLMVHNYGYKNVDKALKILNRIRLKHGLVVKKIYPSYSKFYRKNKYFNEKNYQLINGFYCDYRLD